MKHTEIQIDRRLETVEENETQRVLRKALGMLGPNGENLCREPLPHCGIGPNGELCAFNALDAICRMGRASNARHLAAMFLCDAAGSGAAVINTVVRKDFSAVRAMFERAIELAAS